MFFLQVNGLAATALRLKRDCLKMAAIGHQQHPQAVVKLMKLDAKTHADILVANLYN